MSNFVHLHLHTEYSLLDGMTSPEEAAQIAASSGQSAVAISDHGTMAGVFRFKKACEKNNIKPIFGCEAYFVPSLIADSDDKKAERFHLITLAKNDEGLKKLFQLQQKSWTTGFYYKPRIEWDDLEYLKDDVVILSGCMASLLARLLETGEESEAQRWVEKFKQRFGSDYYLELQPWNRGGLNSQLIGLSDSYRTKVVGTIDCHYPKGEDKGLEELLLMIGQLPSLKPVDDRYAKEHRVSASKLPGLLKKINHMYPNRKLRFDDINNYVMSEAEVVEAFSEVGITREDVIINTLEIAEKCNATFSVGLSLLPKFENKFNSTEYLREIARLNLNEMGHGKDQAYIDRLEEELKIIEDLNFADYFLIVWDTCAFADRQGIARGPGRGSVGGSLLAYALKITKVDPVKHGLLFWRFINAERVSWPDIDMDFEDKRRNEIREYLRQRWGEDCVAGISTYGEFKPKSVVKNIASAFRVPFDQMNKITPQFETVEEFKTLAAAKDIVKQYPEIIPAATKLQNRIRSAGAHPGGIVVSQIPLWNVIPIETRTERGNNRVKVTAFSMEEVEAVGLIKFDILGVKALAVINDCIQCIESYGDQKDIEKRSLACDDPDVIDRFNHDNMVGIFQAEGAGYKKLLSEMKIESFNDIVVSNALVRPGALVTQGGDYLACKSGRRKPEYIHPLVEDILKDTYGSLIFQEQVMELAVRLCDFSWAEADTLRKIIGKKRDAKEFLPLKQKFLTNAVRYIAQEKAEELWNSIEKTALYQFNKSHAVGYSMLSYQCMWLKHYFPMEFIWACLTNEDKNEDIITFLSEATHFGIELYPPCVLYSDENFSIDGEGIRFGLLNVAGCGPAAAQEIISKRPYRSYEEFRERCSKRAVRSTIVENLEKIGAFSNLGYDSGYDEKKYYLSILNCPIYAEEDTRFKDILSKCADVEENNGIHVVRGVVKSTKKGPNYLRVEIEDSSGVVATFANSTQIPLRTKDHIVGLIGEKTLIAYAYVEDEQSQLYDFLLQKSKDPFHDMKNLFDKDKFPVQALSLRWFKTKKDRVMGTLWAWKPSSQRYVQYTLFPTTYERVAHLIEPWEWLVVKIGKKDSVIDDAISLKEFLKIKGVEYAKN